MKILYICKDFTNWIGHGHLAFKKALAKVADVTFYHAPCNASELIKDLAQVGKTFDVLMLGEAPPVTPQVTGLRQVKIPKVVHYWDLHSYQQERLLFLKENRIDLVVLKFWGASRKIFPQLREAAPCKWNPVAVDTSVFRDYKQQKIHDILLAGAISHVYPLRQAYLDQLNSFNNFYRIVHPGYDHFTEEQATVGSKYAKLLNKAKICPTCGSIYEYPIQKFFEIPACRSLLAGPYFSDLEALGFIPDVNFLYVTRHNVQEKIRFILDDPELLEEMTDSCFSMVRKRHSTTVRAKQFVNLLIDHFKFSSEKPFKGLVNYG